MAEYFAIFKKDTKQPLCITDGKEERIILFNSLIEALAQADFLCLRDKACIAKGELDTFLDDHYKKPAFFNGYPPVLILDNIL